MKLLVLGGSGQVGRSLCQAAALAGIEVRAPSRAELDIRNAAEVGRGVLSSAADVAVNCAAYTDVDGAESEPGLAHGVNRDGAENLARAAEAAAIPVIHLSTDYVFDGARSDAYSETDRPNPLSVYGLSKLAGELAVAARAERHVILRTAWVFSAQGANFVLAMRRLGRAGGSPIPVVDDQFGAPTPARDIALCVLRLVADICQAGFASWGVYHYCGRPATSRHDFAKAVLADRGASRVEPIATSRWPTPARRPKRVILNCDLIAETFGIAQPYWKPGLEAVLNELGEGPPIEPNPKPGKPTKRGGEVA